MWKLIPIALCAASLGLAQEGASKRLAESVKVFREIMSISDKSVPQELLNKASCMVIVPGLKKGAFIVGAKYGRGYVSCRKGRVGWSAPAGVRVEGGSFGFQIGGAETDVLMLVLNQRGMDKLLSNKFTLGGDATVAAGPVGRSSDAVTDATMRAEILTWSRARGVFAGIALQGATLRPDDDANKELYGKEMSNRDIVTGKIATPASGRALISTLNRYSSRK